LKPDGIAVHVVPFFAHYPWLAKAAVKFIGSRFGQSMSPDTRIVERASARRSKAQLLARVLLAPRHGERGCALAELWLFGRFSWADVFRRTGWRILAHEPNHIWYTGYELLNTRLNVGTRRHLSHVLGNSCHIYVARPNPAS
jgi:hypothetical protein